MLSIILSKFGSSLVSILRLLYWYGEALFRYFVPPPMVSLDGETVLITGGASGIGREICKDIVKTSENVKLVIWDIDLRGAEKVAEELRSSSSGGGGKGLQVFVYEVDISAKENIKRAAALVKTNVGRVSVVINNAGIAPIDKFLGFSDDLIERTIQVNCMSQLWILREFLGDMMVSNHGRIMSICSIAAFTTTHCAIPYYTSKYGVHGATEALKAELEYFGYDGIAVTTVFPSFTQTPIIGSLGFVEEEIAKTGLPPSMRKPLEPDHVAREAVEGLRRGLEYVYVPRFVGVIPYLESLLPMKQRKAIHAGWGKCITLTDPEKLHVINEGHRIRIQNGKNPN